MPSSVSESASHKRSLVMVAELSDKNSTKHAKTTMRTTDKKRDASYFSAYAA
ncbi:MAG: hypothetical protein WC966_05155 [Bradymonadales bacterium]